MLERALGLSEGLRDAVVAWKDSRLIAPLINTPEGLSKRSVLKLKSKPRNKSEDEIGRFTSSDWSNREKEAQETCWARCRFRICL